MSVGLVSAPLKLVAYAFRDDGHVNTRMLLGIASFSLLQAVAVVVAVGIDDTWQLPKDGLGLLRHYGAWAILASDPLLLVMAGYAHYQFRQTFETLPLAPTAHAKTRLRRLVQRYLNWVDARDFSAFAYIVCVVLGLLCWLNNIRQTEDPQLYFLHDVFDAPPHFVGFVAYKFCLFTSWVIVYPIAGYTMVALSFSTSVILSVSKRDNLLEPHVTHPDNCYGLRRVGFLNLCLVAPFLLSYCVMLCLLFTHGNFYTSISLAMVGMTTIIFVTSYFVFSPTYILFREARTKTYEHLLDQDRGGSELQHAFERLCYGTSDSSPYSSAVSLALAAANLFPLLSAVNFLGQYFVSAIR